jgi:hypothetical protein
MPKVHFAPFEVDVNALKHEHIDNSKYSANGKRDIKHYSKS